MKLKYISLISILSFGHLFGVDKKSPVVLSSVLGIMPKEYQVVNTKIQMNPANISKSDNKIIVTRGVKGKISSSSAKVFVNEELTIPQTDISMSAGAFPDIISKIAGAVDPRAGLVAAGASAAVKEAMRIANDELNKKYKISNDTVNLIEILPSQYYRIDTATNDIKLTQAFTDTIGTYDNLLQSYLPVAKKYNTALAAYSKAYSAWKASDPLMSNPQKKADINNMFNTQLQPALLAKLKVEAKLATYALHRISIMAIPSGPGAGCSGSGKGPWSLQVNYYLGAKQTNSFKIDYCVPNTGSSQKFDLNLNPNNVDAKGNFKPGGISLSVNSNMSFPIVTANGDINYAGKGTKIYSWFDEMVTNENATGISQYMFPFDVYNLEAEAQKLKQEKQDAETKKNLDTLTSAISEIKGGLGGLGGSSGSDTGSDTGTGEEPAEGETGDTGAGNETSTGETGETGGATSDDSAGKSNPKGITLGEKPKGITSPEAALLEEAYKKLGVTKDTTIHEMLKLPATASEQEVSKALVKSMAKWHPDRNANDKVAEEIYKKLNSAKECVVSKKCTANTKVEAIK